MSTALAVGLAAPVAAFAQEAPVGPPQGTNPIGARRPGTGDGIAGRAAGFRDRLEAAGVHVEARYTLETAYNARGGDRSRVATANQALIGATLDLERMAGVEDGWLQVTLTHRHGRDLGDAAGLSTLLPVQEISGRGRIARLTELWFARQLGPDLLVKVGRMPAGDFGSSSCEFLNLAFCGAQLPNIASDYVLAVPISQWGGWSRYGSAKSAFVQVGAYQVTPENLRERAPFEPGDFDDATGVLLQVEAAVATRIGRLGLKGHVKVGGWYDTSSANDVLLDEAGPPAVAASARSFRRAGRGGGYVAIRQETAHLANDPKRPVSLFLNVIRANRKMAPIDYQLGTGVFIQGLFVSRPDDRIGVGYSLTRNNPRIARERRFVDPASALGSERVLEVFYKLQVSRGIAVQPGVQRVGRPGGAGSARSLTVIGLKTELTF